MAAVRVQLGVKKFTKKRYALIDEADLPQIAKFDWRVVASGNTFYAKSSDCRLSKNLQSMHRLILGASSGVSVDHINGNGLDNRRCNLRVATPAENSRNSFKTDAPWPTSKYKGVSWADGRWLAQVKTDGVAFIAGRFDDEEAAARAYDEAALERFGDFARTNEMMGLYPGQVPVDRHDLDAKGVPTIRRAKVDDGLTKEQRHANHIAEWREQARTARELKKRYRSMVPLTRWSVDTTPVLIRDGKVIGSS